MQATRILKSSTVRAAGPVEPDHRLTRIRILCWLFAVVGGACQAWALRNTIATDGVSYLDVSDGFLRGDWHVMVNGYWSPLYPLLLAGFRAVLKSSAYQEFATLHLVNLVLYIGALAGFEFLLRSVLAFRASRPAARQGVPDWLLALAGYCLFIWTSLDLIGVGISSPDMAVAACVFFSAGMVVRTVSGQPGKLHFAALGTTLGIGYLAKAPMFPIAFVFVALAFLGARHLRKRIPAALVSLVMFLAIACLYIVPLSFQKHRLTFGDSGKLNYAWYVDGAGYRHWQGEPLGRGSGPAPKWTAGPVSSGTPIHVTRRVLDTPPVFEFATPVAGTYPVWSDPSYWNEGIRARFDLRQQLRKLAINGKFLYGLLLNPHVIQLYRNNQIARLFSPVFVALLLVLLYRQFKSGFKPGLTLADFWDSWVLLAPALAALAMYSLVYAEPRHVAPFVLLLYFGLLLAIRFDNRAAEKQVIRTVAIGMVIAFLLTVGLATGKTAYAASRHTSSADFSDWRMAVGLRQLGIQPGVKIASLEYSNHANVRWARLARARFVAEIYTGTFDVTEAPYWHADDATKARVMNKFREAGAEIVVSSELPDRDSPPAGWVRVGETANFVYRLVPARQETE